MWRIKQRSTEAFSSREIRNRKLPSLNCTSSPLSTCTTFNWVALANWSCQPDTMKENVSLLIAAAPKVCSDVCEQGVACLCLSVPYRPDTFGRESSMRGSILALFWLYLWALQ